MGIESVNYPTRQLRKLAALVALLAAASLAAGQTQPAPPTQANTVPLMLPAGLAYDSGGNLYFAETGRHVVRRVTPAGVLTTVAGTGVQGFGGDGGPAQSALLDSPEAVAVDATGNVYVADVHNHRIRRVDAATGIIGTVVQLDRPAALALDPSGNIFFADAGTHLVRRMDHGSGVLTTVAGNGLQGYSGDGGTALSASIDSPSGLAVDAKGNLYLADTHNQRVRRVDAVTSIITTVAGTGQPGFSGDGAGAGSAALRLPRGLSLDSAGNLYLTDASNHRLRRIDAATGIITTLAGDGTQGYAGDANPAITAALDSPRSVTLSPGAALPTIGDTANGRVRQVDATAIIHTIGGLGTGGGAETLTLSAPTVVLYGTGVVNATLAASPASGMLTFFDSIGNAAQTLGSAPLLANAATFPVANLGAGPHRLSATYAGDASHAAAQSGAVSLTVAPVPVSATPASVNLLYGQPVPALTGTLTGVLPQDTASVTLALTTQAGLLSPAAAYPIAAALTGPAAGNYALTAAPASVIISKAPTLSTLNAGGMAVHVAPTTSGVAAGTVNLMDGTAPYASATLSGLGDAAFSGAGLSLGSHTLTAVYPGNANLLPSTSAPAIVIVGPALAADFSLAATGQTALTIPAGSAGTFAFAVTPVNGSLSSSIQLTASGLPTGATASFNPAYLPPPSGPVAFILTVQTAKVATLEPPFRNNALALAALLPLLFAGFRRKRIGALTVLSFAIFATGCGDRVNNAATTLASSRTYNITVIATATSTAGATLQHTAGVTLTLQ